MFASSDPDSKRAPSKESSTTERNQPDENAAESDSDLEQESKFTTRDEDNKDGPRFIETQAKPEVTEVVYNDQLATRGSMTPSKSSLNFILGDNRTYESYNAEPPPSNMAFFHNADSNVPLQPSFSEQIASFLSTEDQNQAVSPKISHPVATGSRSGSSRPRNRVCKVEGCGKYIVDKGVCVEHGGGKRCEVPGCRTRVKKFGKCFAHGGRVICKQAGCVNLAKSRGFCWSHGGGTKCKEDGCYKIAVSNAHCWSHGGGKRCIVDGCPTQAHKRTKDYCNAHYKEILREREQNERSEHSAEDA